MNMKRGVGYGIVVCVCLLSGAGIEHLRQSWVVPEREEDTVIETVRVAQTPDRVVTVLDKSAERAAEALRKRVAELEKALAERDAERALQPTGQPQEAAPDEGDGRSRRQSWDTYMERMRTEEPERYAEMQRRREEFRQSMDQRQRERADFLDAVDVAGMSPEQRAQHNQLLETAARANELMAQMMQSGRRQGEEGEALRREIGETMATLGQLYDAERHYLLEATAKAAGYTGNDVQAFSDHIQNIINNTTMMQGMGHRGGGTRGGGGGPPPQ